MGITNKLFTADDIVRAARKSGFRARQFETTSARLGKETPIPGILCLHDNQFALILKRYSDGRLLLQLPSKEEPFLLTPEELGECWTGFIILLANRESLIGAWREFDLKWFIPEFVRYRTQFGEVLIYAIGLLLLQLALPVLFQQVIDRVLVYQVTSTLYAIAIAYLLTTVLTLLLNMLRSAVLINATCKVDVGLGARLFAHLLRLPLSYFETRQTGQTVARVHELDTIREFLTGSALSLLLDIPFILIVLLVMWIYSSTLTLVVLASIVAYTMLAIIITPRLYSITEQRFEKGAINQNFLVESIYGAETVKSMAIEPYMELYRCAKSNIRHSCTPPSFLRKQESSKTHKPARVFR